MALTAAGEQVLCYIDIMNCMIHILILNILMIIYFEIVFIYLMAKLKFLLPLLQ